MLDGSAGVAGVISNIGIVNGTSFNFVISSSKIHEERSVKTNNDTFAKFFFEFFSLIGDLPPHSLFNCPFDRQYLVRLVITFDSFSHSSTSLFPKT